MVPQYSTSVTSPLYPATAFLLDDLAPHHQQLFREGRELFNARKFWEAHEAWEDVWKEIADPQKRLIQGLIQAAAAYHLILTNPRINGAIRNIEKSLARCEGMPAECFGVDVDALRTVLQETHTEVRRLGQDGLLRLGERYVVTL